MIEIEERGLMILSALINFILYPDKPDLKRPPEKILLIKPDHIGDLILAIPAIKTLRSAFPSSRITALVGEWCLPLMELIPEIDEAIGYRPSLFARGRKSGLRERIRLFARLWGGRFDMAVDLRPTPISLALAASKRFRWRIDRSSHRLRMRLRGRGSIWDHEVKRNLEPLKDAGIPLPPYISPSLIVPKRVRDDADGILDELSVRGEIPIVVFHPGSPVKLKRWAPSNFAELGDRLCEELGARVLLIGSGSDLDISRQIISMMRHKPTDLTGRTDLPTLAGVLERCDLFIGNDSGPMHIAAALGVRTIGIFGPSSPERFGPYGERCLAIRSEIDCPPCMSERCPLRPEGCVNEVRVEEVFRAAHDLLTRSYHVTSSDAG